ncbi:hypothetical protein L218DRAFT_952160 [Marasmius fiardii PR-910]|nr:hypothetical protein L218DRAFT_952160 [Marasmius fiardii PR-910]
MARPMKPLRKTGSFAPQEVREVREFVPDPPMLPSDDEEAVTSEGETEETASANPSDDESVDRKSVEESQDEDEDEDDDEDWVPSLPTPRAKAAPRHSSPSPTRPKGSNQQSRFLTSKTRVSNLTKGIDDLKLEDEAEEKDLTMVMPKRSLSGSGTTKKKRFVSVALQAYRLSS